VWNGEMVQPFFNEAFDAHEQACETGGILAVPVCPLSPIRLA
jgi:hypothetical protein